MKFGTVILCNVAKKLVEKKSQNWSYSDDDVTSYVNVLKNYAKNWLKYVFFYKINLVTARKKIFKIFFSAFEIQDNIKIE